MPYTRTVFTVAIAAAFVAGVAISPSVHHVIADAHAATAPLTPAVIDLAALKHADDTVFVD